MDFKILNVAIITRSRLQTSEQLIPPRQWTFPERLRKLETYFHVLSDFGRSFLTLEIASHHQSHQNQWKSRISKDFDEIHGFQDTQYSVWDARSGPFPLELGSISHYEWEGNIFTRCTFWVYSPWLFHRSAVCEMGVGTHSDVREHRRLAQLQLAVSGGLVLLKVARWSAIGESARRRKCGRMGWARGNALVAAYCNLIGMGVGTHY